MRMNKNKPKAKRIAALMLAALLMLSQGSVLAITNDKTENMATAPDVTVVATGTDGGKFIELGFNVQSGSNLFKAAAVVLKYNPKYMTPVKWDEAATNITLKTATDTATNPWRDATNIETVSTTDFALREARGFIMESGAEGAKVEQGYLSLNAAMAGAGKLEQSLPKEALDGKAKTDLAKTGNGMSILPVAEKQKAATPQAAVVKFKVAIDPATITADDKVGKPYTIAQIMASIDIVKDAPAPDYGFAEKSVVKDPSGVWYLADDSTVAALATSTAVDLYFAQISEGTTANSGGGGVADANSFFPLTFYDWDGKTLLGSAIVPKVDDIAEQQNLIEQTLSAKATELSATSEQLAGALWFDDENKPLTYKKGYTFGKWIDYEAKDENGNEVYTNYGKAVAVTDGSTVVELAEPTGYQFSAKDYAGVSLKAAYATNADIDGIANTGEARRYTVFVESYLQFAASDDIGITVKVKRENQEGKGIHRVRKLGLRVSMKMADGTIVYALQTLDNQDEVIATIAVNSAVQSVTAEAIDLCEVRAVGGTTNWASESVARSNTVMQVTGGSKDNLGFVFLGAIGFINDAVKMALELGDTGENIRTNKSTSGVTDMVDSSHYTKADIDVSTVAGATGGAAVRRRGALANIFDRYESLAVKRPLTWAEMQDAITNGTKKP